MFFDYVKIFIKAGDGGDGVVAYRREKFVPMGGPAGGDGGKGASVILVGNKSLSTLNDFKYRRHYKAQKGANGMSKNMYGSGGDDLRLLIPTGTVVKDEEGNFIADICEDGQELVVAKGGRGGRGNAHFSSGKDKASAYSEKGEPGEERTLVFELKTIADVGLIGLPNAGKSTLLSKISAAEPKIANYPFTTLEPNLGVVRLDDDTSFVVADLPGLIEGAASGIGLGHRFLRHAERNRILVHVLDMSEFAQRTPIDSFELINNELSIYKEDFLAKPMLIAANKADMPGFEESLAELKKQFGNKYEIFAISALTGEGIKPLLWKIKEILDATPILPYIPPAQAVKHTVVRAEEPFTIKKDSNGVWQVGGIRVEKLVMMTDLNNDDAVLRMQRIFVKMGLEDSLREAGVEPGDSVNIAGNEFEYAE
jgi:GTPase